MTERIAFVSYESGMTEDGVPTDAKKTTHMTVWAEVPKIPIREVIDPQTKLNVRRETPTFLIRFLTEKEIDNRWRIEWRGQEYEISGFDPDYQRRDVTTITAKVVAT
jgi:SPP1 family predicted phage head-tail adaptor